MSRTYRVPFAPALTAPDPYGWIKNLARHNARLVGDHHSGHRYNDQFSRYADNSAYRRASNYAVRDYLIGKTDDVFVDRRVHGYLD